MGEVEINIGGIVEERRLNTMKQINNEVEYVAQDNSDLEDLQLLYEKLPLSRHDRDIIDSIFLLHAIPEWNDREIGILRRIIRCIRIFETIGPVHGPFSTFKRQLLNVNF